MSRKHSLHAISPFPTVFSKDLYYRHIKTKACLGKSIERLVNTGPGTRVTTWLPMRLEVAVVVDVRWWWVVELVVGVDFSLASVRFVGHQALFVNRTFYQGAPSAIAVILFRAHLQ